MESYLKKLINLCELSAQTLFLHGRTELPFIEKPSTLFSPKQIASMDRAELLCLKQLETKHMAYLLRRSIFTETKKKDIRVALSHIELKA